MKKQLSIIKACRLCEKSLPLGPNPVVSASINSKICIVGQAPGIRVHKSSIPWNDPSGNNLRDWLGVTKEQFYNPENFAIIPMAFCYPGTGAHGDLPPSKICAPQWHGKLNNLMPHIKLTLLVGNYAQKFYLGKSRMRNLTETVRNFQQYLPELLPLPHPSPRNNIWQSKNPWFKHEVLPYLKDEVATIIS